MTLIEFLNIYVSSSIIAFGLPGNLLTALVFLCTKLKKHSASFYLASLAIADACYLLAWMIALLDYNGKIDIINKHHFACHLVTYAANVFTTCSVWLTVVFTVERYIALAYPLHRPSLCTVTKARVITLGLFSTACLANLYVNWVMGINERDGCQVKREYINFSNVLNYVDTLLTLILPAIVIVVMNALIGRTVNRYRDNTFLHQVEDESTSVSTKSLENKQDSQNRRIASERIHQSDQRSSVYRDRRAVMVRSQCNITKLIVLTSTTFVVLNIPSYIVRIIMFTYHVLDKDYPWELISAQRIVNIFYQANFSLNFLLYAMCGTTFRQALITFVRDNVNIIKKCLRITP